MYRNNVPGADLVNALATRTVKHQNQQHFISVPILLGTSIKRGRWELGLNAGVGINKMIRQSGKSLDRNQMVKTYEQGKSTALPASTFFWSLQVQPYIQYQFRSGAAIQLRPSFRMQNHGTSSLHALRHRSYVSGISMGLLF